MRFVCKNTCCLRKFEKKEGQSNTLQSCMRINTVAAGVNSPSISVASSNAGNRKDDEYSLEQWSSVKQHREG